MRRSAARYAGTIVLCSLLSSCQVWQIVVDKDFDPDPVPPDYTFCQEDTINPEFLRNLPPGYGVSKTSYDKVLKANRQCIKSLGDQNMHNFEAAKIKGKKVDESYSSGMKLGALGVLGVEVILVILYFL